MLSVHQSAFCPGDSCVHQLISIVREIYNAFDTSPSLEVTGAFLDISKAFDRVWHKGLLHKLKCMSINGNVLKLVESFLSNRYQRVVLNGQASSLADIKASIPQGSIICPFFPIYIYDLYENLKSTIKLFADDTSIFHAVKDPNTSAEILTITLLEFQNGHTDGKCHLIWTLQNKLRKCCFLTKLQRQIIQILYLMVTLYKKVPIKSTLV